MGYTRYWTQTDKDFTDDFLSDVKKIIDIGTKHGIVIRNTDGYDEPVVNKSIVGLNGNAETNEDYETFALDDEDKGQWNFCKTAERPYDAVVHALLDVAESYGIVEKVQCDGDSLQDDVYKSIMKEFKEAKNE